MTERKVLNKYYPPDYDYRKIPRLRRPKDQQWTQRLMAPFNMRCNTCGAYIYRGTKFNAKRETAQNETYLGLKIFRFYIKCSRCCADISFKTDIENVDYAIEYGATRNFEAVKLIAEEEKRAKDEQESEEANNPMKVLENRTRDSRREMEIMENLEELKEISEGKSRVDVDALITKIGDQAKPGDDWLTVQEKLDEQLVRNVFKINDNGKIEKRLPSTAKSTDELPPSKLSKFVSSSENSTDILVEKKPAASKPSLFTNLVKVKKRSILNGIVSPRSFVSSNESSKNSINAKSDVASTSTSNSLSNKNSCLPSFVSQYSDSESSFSDG